MKNLQLVAAAVALLLTMSRVQCIRLDAESHNAFSNHAESHDAFNNQMVNKSGEIAVKNNMYNEPLGETMDESISEEKARVGHKLPEIHVDYYGPRGHKPMHH